MKRTLFIIGFLLLTTVMAQQQENTRPDGVIYGIAIGQDGQPAKGIGLTAFPLGIDWFCDAIGPLEPEITLVIRVYNTSHLRRGLIYISRKRRDRATGYVAGRFRSRPA